MKQLRNSIRIKITILTVAAIIVTVTIATLLGVMAIQRVGSSDADRMLMLLCETGGQNLDAIFQSIEQSVEMVATLVEEDLNALTPIHLKVHMNRVQPIVERIAIKTNGVLTYYYRIDPTVSINVPGFWYTNLDGDGFVPHEVTDIRQFDTNDTSELVWFTVPKATGESVWQPPYITNGLDARVVSYNHPIYYRDDLFVGVLGMEIDYDLIAQQVNHVKLGEDGYAFIVDANGDLVFHPRIDVLSLTDETRPQTPEGLLSESAQFNFVFEGVEKRAVWRPLRNGMRLVVSVPTSQINSSWRKLIEEVFVVSAMVLIGVILVILRFTSRITKPLRELTEAAKQMNNGNYDLALDYRGNDEVGILTVSFNQLIRHLKSYISDLNSLAYADALTHVRNKGAYEIYVRALQTKLEGAETYERFAIGVFDCDNLKDINDRYGHEKGDLYLKSASHLICHIFVHSPVFRIGGDEFSIILQNEDLRDWEALTSRFQSQSVALSKQAEHPWEEVHISMGIAVYDPQIDRSVSDVACRADKLMYQNKRERKTAARSKSAQPLTAP